MKRALFALMLCLLAFTGRSQNIINNTGCALTMRSLCYDPATCVTTPCTAFMNVPPGVSSLLPFNCGCVAPNRRAFEICCGTTCVIIGPPNPPYACSTIGPTTALPCCGAIWHVSWAAGPNLVIN